MQAAKDYRCDYIYVFKEGRTPALWQEFQALLELRPEQQVVLTTPEKTRQVYRWMDVGTAKPSCADRARVAHHLIDLLDPAESYCAARFVQDARASIAAIRARGRLPLLVGGTMLYAKALREGLAELPPADPEVRDRLARQAAESGWPALHARLREVDPRTAQRLSPADGQRIVLADADAQSTHRLPHHRRRRSDGDFGPPVA